MTEAEESIIGKVAERLGFFFSDANLRIDKFLRHEVMNKQNDGFVTIQVLLKFNTIKSITEDAKLIAKAVKDVKRPLLKLNDDESAIARVNPFTKDMMRDNVKVTLRVSDIPTKDSGSGAQYDVSREEILDLFKEFGDVAMVRLLKGKFKGNPKQIAIGRGFVEFHLLEDMEKAVAELCTEDINDESLKPKKTLSLKGTQLKVKTMQQWLDKKKAQKAEKGHTKSPRLKGKDKNKDKKNDKDKKRKAEEELEEEMKAQLEAIEFKLDWKPGCVISLKGLPDGCDREMILEAVKSFMGDGDITVRADYSRGQENGAVRFDEPNDKISSLAADLKEGKITIGGKKVQSVSLLEGEEEKTYYDKYIAFRTTQLRTNAEEKFKRKKRRNKQ